MRAGGPAFSLGIIAVNTAERPVLSRLTKVGTPGEYHLS